MRGEQRSEARIVAHHHRVVGPRGPSIVSEYSISCSSSIIWTTFSTLPPQGDLTHKEI